MKSKVLIAVAVTLLACSAGSWAVTGLSIDHIDGAIDANSVATGTPITFHIRLTNDGANIVGTTNGFRIYSPSGATWDTTSATLTGAITTSMMESFFINEFSTDGAGADTVGFGGFSLFAPGIPTGFDTIPYTLTIGPIDPIFHGRQICIDSSFYRPAGTWLWSIGGGTVIPSWDGPHCYAIIDTGAVGGGGAFSLDYVDGLAGPNTLATGTPITFHIRMSNQTGNNITGLTNGFRVFSPTGAQWGSTSGDTTGTITSGMMENFFVNGFSLDGMGADTVGFGGFRLFTPGIPDGFDAITYRVHIGPINPAYGGGQICLDSAFYPPASTWKWSTTGGDHFPSWDGPHCFDIEGSQPVPRIVSVNPNNADRGEALWVTVIGENTAFGMGSSTSVRLLDQYGWHSMWAGNVSVINSTYLQAYFFIDDSATVGPYSLTVFVGGQDSVALAPAFWVNPAPQLVSIDPDSAQQGENLWVTITGSNTHFTQASWTALRNDFGEWIWPSNWNAQNDSALMVYYNIPISARTGPWDVQVSGSDGTLMLYDAFTILASGQPSIVNVNPDSAYQGQMLDVYITGQNTHFLQASWTNVRLSTTSPFPQTITAYNVLRFSNTYLRASFNIPQSVTTGLWDVSVEQGLWGTVTMPGGFTILPSGQAQIVSIIPDSAQQGQSLWVTIRGSNTHFTQASRTVLRRNFEPTIWPSSWTAVNDSLINALYFIPQTAALGLWDVEVYGPVMGTLVLQNGFTIVPAGGQSIVMVDPDSAYQGQSLDVYITGLGTHFQQASLVTVSLKDSMYASIPAASIMVFNNEYLRARFNIPNSAPPGYRDVWVTQGMYGTVAKQRAFRIISGMITDVSLDHVDGLVGPNTLGVNQPIRFYMRLRNSNDVHIVGSTNGFRLYSNSGAQWGSTSGQWTSGIPDSMYDQKFVNMFSANGMNSDTIGFGGFRLFSPGIPPGFEDIVWTIDIGPISPASAGGQICIDSAFYPPVNEWLWSLGSTKTNYVPTWDGPHCFAIDTLFGGNPQIAVYPDSFYVSQAPDDSTMRILTIGNSGSGALNYLLDIVFAEPSSTVGDFGTEFDPDVVEAQKNAQVSTEIENSLAVWEANGVDDAAYRRQVKNASASGAAVDQFIVAPTGDPGNKTNIMIEDFDSSLTWPWVPWVPTGVSTGMATSGCAHNGPRGVYFPRYPGWNYRTDVTVGMPGCRLSIWVKPDSLGGRAYMGFGATSAGAWSLVAAPNTNQLIVQQNSGYDYVDLVAVFQSYLPENWYKLEVVFGDSGFVTGNLYAADGVTLLNSLSTMIPGLPQAGVAIRGFGFCMDTFESVNDTSSGWLRADRHSGSIPGGGADDVILTFDAANLTPGEYLAGININSNDPVSPSVMVLARMLVRSGGGTDLSLIYVDGLTMAGKLPYGQPIAFHIGLRDSTGMNIIGSTNGFQVYSPTGAQWTTTTGMPTGAIDSTMYDQGIFVSPFSIDGMGADTLGFGGFRMFGTGIPDGFSEDVWVITIGPIPESNAGGTICLDSAFYRPAGIWKWSLGINKTDYFPSWDGPHCFQIEDSFQPCSLAVAPNYMMFIADESGPNPPCQSLNIQSNCTVRLTYDTTWLNVGTVIDTVIETTIVVDSLTGDTTILVDTVFNVGYQVCADVGGLPAGMYRDSIHVWLVENPGLRTAVVVDLEVLPDSSCMLQYFTGFVETGLSYPYVISAPPVCSLMNGDEFGLFDVEQGLLVGARPYCGEAFPLNVNAWQSDSLHGLPGYIPGNHVEVRVYKKSLDKVLCTDISGSCLLFNECTFGIIDSMNCRPCYVEFCMPLASNRWRTISLPVSPVNPVTGHDMTCEVEQIFSPLNQLDIIKDDHGGVYIPSFGINTIGCIDPCEGYDLFKYGQTEQLCIIGQTFPPICCIIQANRWNIIGYPMLCPLPIDFVTQSIMAWIDIIKDDDGGVFIPMYGINTIGNMQPGKGYKIFIKGQSDRTLCYPGCFEPVTIASDGGVPFTKPADSRVKHYEYTVTGLAYPIVLSEIGDLIKMGDEIAVFDGDLCVGAIRYQAEEKLVLNAWKSDPEHNLPGYTPGHKLDIRLRSREGAERSLLTHLSAPARFDDGSYQVINLAKVTALPKEYALSQNYPNPFNPTTVVQFALPEAAHVTLEVYNILGRRVITLIDADYQAGNHEITWSGDDSYGRPVSTGVYLYRLSANNFTQTKKMMLVK